MSHRKNAHRDPLRFEFSGNIDPRESATITELLEDLSLDRNYTNEENPTFASLKRTLEFIESVSGIKCKSTTERLPLMALKTIKLLFMTNHKRNASNNKKRDLFNIIAPPNAHDPGRKSKSKNIKDNATMEFATTSTTSPDKEAANLIASLRAGLALEIDEDRLMKIDVILKDAKSILNYIEAGTYRSVDYLSERIGNSNIGMANAYTFLTKRADEYQPRHAGEATAPLNEIVYTYLKSLGFIHFATRHNTHSKSIRIHAPIPSITAALASFCETLNGASGSPVEPDTAHVSVNDVPMLVADFPKQFSSIVKIATGAKDYRKEQLIDDANRAKKILIVFISRNFECEDPNVRTLSLRAIIAALCSLKYQRENGGSYEYKWPGAGQEGNSPQRFFDETDRKKAPTMPQGIFITYYERFSHYLHAFTGMAECNDAWMDFQSSRLNAYTRILRSNNIDIITRSIREFDQHCLEQTVEAFIYAVKMHGQDTQP